MPPQGQEDCLRVSTTVETRVPGGRVWIVCSHRMHETVVSWVIDSFFETNWFEDVASKASLVDFFYFLRQPVGSQCNERCGLALGSEVVSDVYPTSIWQHNVQNCHVEFKVIDQLDRLSNCTRQSDLVLASEPASRESLWSSTNKILMFAPLLGIIPPQQIPGVIGAIVNGRGAKVKG